MKRLFGLALAGLLFLCIFSAPAAADRHILKVQTQNLYIGADLTPLITATSGEQLLAAAEDTLTQIALNNFVLRAQRLATEIALTQPHLIGLQEVLDFTLDGEHPRPPFVDYLDTLLNALAARGQSYVVAATVVNLNITIPLDVDGDGVDDTVGVLDRDVILVREGVTFTNLTGLYTGSGLCGFPIPNPAYVAGGPLSDILESTVSEDGCNYTIFAKVVGTPIGEIFVKRGFVGVDATVGEKNYRFVNTHLEQREPDPTNPGSAIIQFLQSVELVGTLQAITPSDDRTLILVGDFNSSPDDEVISPTIIPPYEIISEAAFADIWDTNPLALFDPDGFTCCQDPDLGNRRSALYERIDIIFVPDSSFLSRAVVTGQVPIFPLWLPPNWSSDHGGVFARLIF
jgi:endonuclease/exonuclease/phosphatase family metal-dependent hydrolase